MWATIITSLLPFAIKLITMFFEKNESNKEAKVAFLNFISVMEQHSGNSAKLRISYKEQIERLKDAINKKNNNPL